MSLKVGDFVNLIHNDSGLEYKLWYNGSGCWSLATKEGGFRSQRLYGGDLNKVVEGINCSIKE
jgi:hypothetical protein